MTIRPSYAKFGYGVYIRDRLTQAGPTGVVPSDLWKELKPNWKALDFARFRGNGTYASFIKYWQLLKELKYITKSGKTEIAHHRNVASIELAQPRIFYRLTTIGRRASDKKWSNPLVVLYPQADSKKRLEYFRGYLKGWRRERREKLIAMGMPVRKKGRPRVAPPVELVKPAKPKPPPKPKPPVKPPKLPKVVVSEKLEAEVKALVPLIDRLVAEPGLVTQLEEQLEDILTRTREATTKARGKERERLDALLSRLATTIEHLPLVPTALRLPPGTRREGVLVSAVAAIKGDLGIA